MRIVRYVVLTLTLCLLVGVPAGALETTPTITPKPNSPLLLTEFRTDNATVSYIQLFNNSNEAQYVANWELLAQYEDGEYRYRLPEGYLAPNNYLVVSAPGVIDSDVVEVLGGGEEFRASDQFSLVSKTGVYAPEPIPIASAADSIRYHRYKSTAGNYTGTRTFSALKDQLQPVQADALEEIREDFPLAPIEILPNPQNCAPGETDLACHDYVKFYNHTNEVVDFNGVRLRVGYAGQSPTASNAIPLQGEVQPGEYVVFNMLSNGSRLNLPNSGAFVWLEYVHGVIAYEHTIVEYPDASSRKGQSWAVGEGGDWYWAIPQPAGSNAAEYVAACQEGYYRHPDTNRCRKYEEVAQPVSCKAGYERNPDTGRCRKIQAVSVLMPCQEGYYRHPDTNRCRKKQVPAQPKPCGPNQYRSPETGRCRNNTTASAPKPCAPGQYRNPETGRCKKVASASGSKLKPCAPGQERNPATNRCRKIQKDLSKPGFKAEEVVASADAIASWWALGGVGTLALSYAGWEWRGEMAQWARRVRELFSSRG